MSADAPAGISEEELSAYLDDNLEPLRRAQVEAAIRADSRLARRVATYRAQERDLRSIAAAVLDEPVPERLLDVVRRPPPPGWRRPLRQGLPLAASLLIGIAVGWLLHEDLRPADDSLLEPFVQRSVLAHQLFEADEALGGLRAAGSPALEAVRSPFRTPIRVPGLVGTKTRPVLLHALEGSVGPGIDLAYLDDQGTLTSLLIRQHSASDDVPVQFRTVEGRSVLYWLDGPLIYALVGDRSEAELLAMARGIYATTASGGGWPSEASGR